MKKNRLFKKNKESTLESRKKRKKIFNSQKSFLKKLRTKITSCICNNIYLVRNTNTSKVSAVAVFPSCNCDQHLHSSAEQAVACSENPISNFQDVEEKVSPEGTQFSSSDESSSSKTRITLSHNQNATLVQEWKENINDLESALLLYL